MNLETLQKFCSTDEMRENLARPWTVDEFTYATDGCMLIRVPRIEGVEGNTSAPNVKKFFSEHGHDDGSEWLLIPETKGNELVPCDECGGSGKYDECQECEGSGKVEYENDYNTYGMTCKTCDGSGKAGKGKECELCDGSGKMEKVVKIELNGVLFNAGYLKLISALPSCQIQVTVSEMHPPAYFRFDGGVGLLMPMRGE